jgi:hypothetical protein
VWLESWAYATSPAPYGLGMSSAESWALTPREFEARNDVRRQYMAEWRTELRNAPFFTRIDKKPWAPAHFLEAKAPAGFDKAATLMAQAEIALGLLTEDKVPDWAKGPYKRREKVVAINV